MPKFAKRHYEAIADAFAAHRPADYWDANKRVQHNLLLKEVLQTFERDNPNFKPDKFIKAAGGWAYEKDQRP